ncbi:hypothetical protein ACHAWF_016620 [Thalassiosira exigua]
MTDRLSANDGDEPTGGRPPDEGEGDDEDCLCTLAVTGPIPAHQAIFVCETCKFVPREVDGCEEDDEGDGVDDDVDEPEALPACVCRSCADACHSGHDVRYVGSGPCTCDCPFLTVGPSGGHDCRLAGRSVREARRLGFGNGRTLNDPISSNAVGGTETTEGTEGSWCGECCPTPMGGYAYASYTLPDLSVGGDNLCQNLIRQAEALIECSRDTFWVPDHAEQTSESEWCDLELLAMQIYRKHVKSYSLKGCSEGEQATTSTSEGGAEWWVQVKPAGTSRAPVDLHYDKDEVLAEEFGLGSFPALSTVLNLTGGDDNVPTVVFPHTYDDDEERPIEWMLLSRPVAGKHLVFDGRLLHGAPAHEALHRPGEPKIAAEESSLRITFLVNVWTSGRPAGVHVLPESIRSKIRSVGMNATTPFESLMPLEFRTRPVSRITASSDSGDVESDEDPIVLPFVSQGATWIGEEGEENEVVHEDQSGKRENDDSDDEEEEGEELVLALPPFATPRYLDDRGDTMLLSFEGTPARLVRGWGSEDESEESDDHMIALADDFVTYLNRHASDFVTSVVAELKRQCGIDATELRADHICYRTVSTEQYTSLVDSLRRADDFSLLIESEIGGRPIATFKLATPIEIKSDEFDYVVDVVEIPSPKAGSPYPAGLEHVEFVVGCGAKASPMNDKDHQEVLNQWMDSYRTVPWNTKALHKQCNPDVSTKLALDGYGAVSVKFHLIPLEDVIEFEKACKRNTNGDSNC